MLDGFLETIWIDADIGFHLDAIEELRAHSLPIVCGTIRRRDAANIVPYFMPLVQPHLYGL